MWQRHAPRKGRFSNMCYWITNSNTFQGGTLSKGGFPNLHHRLHSDVFQRGADFKSTILNICHWRHDNAFQRLASCKGIDSNAPHRHTYGDVIQRSALSKGTVFNICYWRRDDNALQRGAPIKGTLFNPCYGLRDRYPNKLIGMFKGTSGNFRQAGEGHLNESMCLDVIFRCRFHFVSCIHDSHFRFTQQTCCS